MFAAFEQWHTVQQAILPEMQPMHMHTLCSAGASGPFALRFAMSLGHCTHDVAARCASSVQGAAGRCALRWACCVAHRLSDPGACTVLDMLRAVLRQLCMSRETSAPQPDPWPASCAAAPRHSREVLHRCCKGSATCCTTPVQGMQQHGMLWQVIGRNIKSSGDLNPMLPGHRVTAVFGFCDIRQFTDATEVLQEDVMEFVNSIAKIVHLEVS